MKHTAVWKPEAEEELARLWTEAPDRGDVTAAADEIDRLLDRSPLDQGESRSGATRIFFVDPIGVIYDVSEGHRLVSVLRVWRIP